MKKFLFTFAAMSLCAISSFAQIALAKTSTQLEFKANETIALTGVPDGYNYVSVSATPADEQKDVCSFAIRNNKIIVTAGTVVGTTDYTLILVDGSGNTEELQIKIEVYKNPNAPTWKLSQDGNHYEFTLAGDWNTLNDNGVLAKVVDEIMDVLDDDHDCEHQSTPTFALGTGKQVYFLSEEGNYATVNPILTQQLVTGRKYLRWNVGSGEFMEEYHAVNIDTLDLSGVQVTRFYGHTSLSNDGIQPTATFKCINGSTANYIRVLKMPRFADVPNQDYTIPTGYMIAQMPELESLYLPVNTKKVSTSAFAGSYDKFQHFVLNEGLEFIGNSAFAAANQRTKSVTLDIPQTVKYIGPGAFYFWNIADIYFHSLKAPICPVGRMVEQPDAGEQPFIYGICYEGNNGQNSTKPNKDNYVMGYANRDNFWNGDYPFLMVHYPAYDDYKDPTTGQYSITKEEYDLNRATYEDITRVYHKVYGNLYDGQTPLTIGVPGYEPTVVSQNGEDVTYSIDQTKPGMSEVWGSQTTTVFDLQNSFDLYVGKETKQLTSEVGGQTQSTDYLNTWVYSGYGTVNSGMEDTYRGLNYIWPSQSQYKRAYTTVYNGLCWDGVTKYRPELSDEEIALMIEDGLQVKYNGNYVLVGANITYTEADANAYNAKLVDAVHKGDIKETYDAGGAIAYNATLEDAVKENDTHSFSDVEAAAYNAKLEDAISTNDIKEPAVEGRDAVYYTDAEKEWVNDVQYVKETLIYHEEVPTVYYENDEFTNLNGNLYKVEDLVSLDGYYSDAYLQSMGIPNYDYLYSGDTKTDENGTVLYKYSKTIAAPGAVVVGYQWQLDQGQRIVKVAGTAAYYEVSAESKKVPSDNIKIPGVVGHGDIYYTADEVKAYNQDLPGAVKPGDYVTFTAETAAAYNAALPGAVKEGDVKETWTEEDAIAHNANLDGARESGYTENNLDNAEMQDLLSMIAYQSTRRTVFADIDSPKGEVYPVPVKAESWWTICLPYDLKKYQIDKYFGKGTHVCYLNRVDRDEAEGGMVKFYFTADQYPGKEENDVVLKAHHPYMIYPKKDSKDAVNMAFEIPFSEVVIEPGQPVPSYCLANMGYKERGFIEQQKAEDESNNWQNNKSACYYSHDVLVAGDVPVKDDKHDHTEYRFIGNYSTKVPVNMDDLPSTDGATRSVVLKDATVPENSYFYAKKNGDSRYRYWFVQNNNIPWAANKCIIQNTAKDGGFKENSTFFTKTSQVKTINLGDEVFEDTTPIENIVIIAGDGENSEVIYNLNGVQIMEKPQRGIYIQGGKKYFAR